MAKKSETPLEAVDNDETALADVDSTDDGLVEVRKGGEALRVHPTCVRAHVEAGWSA